MSWGTESVDSRLGRTAVPATGVLDDVSVAHLVVKTGLGNVDSK